MILYKAKHLIPDSWKRQVPNQLLDPPSAQFLYSQLVFDLLFRSLWIDGMNNYNFVTASWKVSI